MSQMDLNIKVVYISKDQFRSYLLHTRNGNEGTHM